jgi:hypothetical protein
MFYLSDSTQILEIRCEVFIALEIQYEDNRRAAFLWALVLPIFVVLAAWWNGTENPSDNAFWQLLLAVTLEISMIAIGFFSWWQLREIRKIMRLADREIERRENS